MIKLANNDNYTYINEDKIILVQSYSEKGYETSTMKKVTQYIIEIYLDNDTVITNSTYHKKDFINNIRCLEKYLDVNEEDKL